MVPETKKGPRYIWGPSSDFWALGGASILLWLFLLAGDFFKEASPVIQQRFTQVTIVFSFLSLVVNYPHFMISYRIGYGRGARFVLRHWPALLLVPFTLIALFTTAYFFFWINVGDSRLATMLDAAFHFVGFDSGFRERGALGKEIFSLAIWTMYFTVGWHYSKQVFGCMMIYARLRGYAFTALERQMIKANLYGVAVYQFVYINSLLENAGSSADSRFPGIVITAFHFSPLFQNLTTTFLWGSTAVVALILIRLFRARREWPEPNFLVSWLSFLVWWIPAKALPEFYVLAVPFFHSLQYLAFAAKLEDTRAHGSRFPKPRIVALVLLTLCAGIAAFEVVPSALDQAFSTATEQSALFFVSAAGVFINIHHFFIDSVVWKFHQEEIRRAFFS